MFKVISQLEALVKIQSLEFDEDFEEERKSGKVLSEIKKYKKKINQELLTMYEELKSRYRRRRRLLRWRAVFEFQCPTSGIFNWDNRMQSMVLLT